MTQKPSGRILVGPDGKEEHVAYDEKDKASVDRAHGYDLKPGALFNAIHNLPLPARDLVLALPQKDRERIMALEGDALAAAIAALAKPAETTKAPPAGANETKGSAR